MPAKIIKRDPYLFLPPVSVVRYITSCFLLAAWAVFITSIISTSLFAQDRMSRITSGGAFHVSADKIEFDTTENLYIARGHAIITKDGDTLTAEEIRYNTSTMKASASGNVVLTSGEDVITGSHMDLDLSTETGRINNGDLFFKTSQVYISGDSIRKIDKGEYSGKNVIVTSCDGKPPAWKISGKNLKVALEGYGTATHAMFWLKNIPVFYTPFMAFPVKSNRQSGLLTPEIDYSDRLGFAFEQPLFWAINDSTDATFYAHYLSFRGLKTGVEFRYVLDPLSLGTIMLDVLNDRKVDDGRLNSSRDWGYEDDAVLRPNADRYWFRMRNDYDFDNGFFAELDLDIVSDQDYLHEFKDGYTGFKKTNEYFTDIFGRTLERLDDPIRTNRLNLNKSWGGFTLNSEVLWYDDVIQRRQKDKNTTLQRLPVIEFDMIKQQILDSYFYQDMNASYTHFYREEGTRGHRLDTQYRLYLPARIKHIMAVESSLGLRQTTWYIDEYAKNTVNKDRTFFRGIYDLQIDMSTELFRIFSLPKKPFSRIKHNIRPQIVYQYVPELSQDKYPFFDTLDRIPEKNLLTYSVTSLLISRSDKKMRKGDPNGHGSPVPSYHQFFRLELEQRYDLNKANQDDPEPFSPVYARFEITPVDNFSLDAESQWSIYQDRFISRNAAMNIRDNRGDRIFVEYRNTRGEIERNNVESINLLGDFRLSQQLSVYGGYERNIYDGKTIKQEIGMLYQTQCWSLNIRYWEEENNYKVRFSIKLNGLGDIGS